MSAPFALRPRGRSRLAGAALALAWFSILVTLYALVLLRLHAVEAFSGFAAFLSGLALAALAALLGILAMVLVWRSGRRGGVRAFVAVVLAACVLAGPAYVAGRNIFARGTDDVSTDLADPPRFDRAGRDRAFGERPAPGPIVPAPEADRQRTVFRDLAPLRLALSEGDVAGLALGLVEARGWRLLGPTSFPRGGPPTGRIEAIAPSPILGIRDAVSIRIRPDAEGARVDMRSVSRLPGVDFGTNAKRIESFLADLAAAANAAP
ncbi:DUF1499 domain-containing protein [Hansschlegelia quercus]|uniref:DUF1499 domain-containing protein n=1 Tax=Hansschlegelia quercus TaxID=2528245 RepID=A0A4Q9GPX9_9HYPH|nr:DUF1499 domain-containing protein [Hansschlegelia quercus]TBN54854.1 DUF1499 domain-containing protein [Hansschlegelia quercus]